MTLSEISMASQAEASVSWGTLKHWNLFIAEGNVSLELQVSQETEVDIGNCPKTCTKWGQEGK